ncbi:hypothetical protein PVAP13_3NG181223 [Panicum virgatum]|uniref:Uncharacterized protein n=1 Tax=Panicum virgatum TaxID=38727 RepID=A0A8T0TZ25_PANVG|nr:hypothetical protein PVAP13_3NG181223 [Panicum virgatum]
MAGLAVMHGQLYLLPKNIKLIQKKSVKGGNRHAHVNTNADMLKGSRGSPGLWARRNHMSSPGWSTVRQN